MNKLYRKRRNHSTTSKSCICIYLVCAGAKVKLDCRDRDNQKLVRYTAYGETNPAGEFEFEVSFDHGDDICKCSLISSPLPNCSKIEEGRESAEVFLTNNNGIISNHRHANNLGFVQDHQSAGCAQVMKQYQPLESEYL